MRVEPAEYWHEMESRASEGRALPEGGVLFSLCRDGQKSGLEQGGLFVVLISCIFAGLFFESRQKWIMI